jgi:hydroxyacylglutathione hydrolase
MYLHNPFTLFASFLILSLAGFVPACTWASVLPEEAVFGALADLEQVEEQLEELSSSVTVHRLNLGVSNAYLLETSEGLILVDAGMPFSEGLVLEKMEELGRDDLKLIYITHAHIDHFGGANALRDTTGAPIAIHRDDALAMAEGRTELGNVRDWEETSDAVLPYIEPLLELTPTEADILLDEGDTLAEYGIDAYVLHTPGHTPGSSTLIVEDQLAFVGDLMSSNGKPHAQGFFADDWEQVAESIDRLKSLDPVLIYTGHGSEPITQEVIRTVNANFVDDEAKE